MRPAVLLIAVTFALAGCKPKKIASREAEVIFREYCAKCHGPDGTGLPAEKAKLGVRDLTDAAWQQTVTDAQLTKSIKKGKKNMPSWGAVLDDEQVRALIVKVRSLARR